MSNISHLPKTKPKFPFRHIVLAGNSKTTPRIFSFSIVLGDEYLSYVTSIATDAPTFLGYIIKVLDSVSHVLQLDSRKN